MNTSKNSSTKREPRNLGVTVVSGVLTLVFATLAFYLFTGSQDFRVYGFVFGLLAAISFGIAIYGRKSLSAIMAELFFWIP